MSCDTEALRPLLVFRQELYQSVLGHRKDSAFELSEAVLCAAGPEPLTEHVRRLGQLDVAHVHDIIPALVASGLLGRGGAGFPVGRKWQTVAERSNGDAAHPEGGAGWPPRCSHSSRTPGRTWMMVLPWSVGPGWKVLPCIAACT